TARHRPTKLLSIDPLPRTVHEREELHLPIVPRPHRQNRNPGTIPKRHVDHLHVITSLFCANQKASLVAPAPPSRETGKLGRFYASIGNATCTASCIRWRMISQYSGSRSIPIIEKPSSTAAMRVVPEPANGSRIRPPGGVISRHR